MTEVLGNEGDFDQSVNSEKKGTNPGERLIVGSKRDGTVDGSYYSSSLATQDALEGMTDEQRKEYEEISNKIGEVGQPIKTTEKPGSSVGQGSVAVFLAGMSAVTGVGVAAAETTSPSDANPKNGTEMVSEFKGETSSEALKGYGIKADSEVTPGPNPGPNPETTPSVLDIATPEYIKETQDMIKKFDTPLPMERIRNIIEADKIKTFGPFEEELRKGGVIDEDWVEWGAKVLFAYENIEYMTLGMDKFTNYISRDEFIASVVAGKGENVFCDEDGKPLFLLVNFTDDMVDGLKAAAKKIEKSGITNLYDGWRDSGACIFYADILQPNLGKLQALFNQWGVINFNIDESSAKNASLTNIFARNSIVEPIGVAYSRVTRALEINYLEEIAGANWIGGYGETIKDETTGKIMANLKDRDLKNFSKGMLKQAEHYASIHNLSLESDWSKRLTQLIFEVVDITGEDLIKADKK